MQEKNNSEVVKITSEELADQCNALSCSLDDCIKRWRNEYQERTSLMIAASVMMSLTTRLIQASLPEEKVTSSALLLLHSALVDDPGVCVKEAVAIMQENNLAELS